MTQEEMTLKLSKLYNMAVFACRVTQLLDKTMELPGSAYVPPTLSHARMEEIINLHILMCSASETVQAASQMLKQQLTSAAVEIGARRNDLKMRVKSFPEQAAKYAEEFDLD